MGTTVIAKKSIVHAGLLFASGYPPYSSLGTAVSETRYANVADIDWINYIINKYTDNNDKVLFMGSFRPAGIKRKHYFSLSLNKQPILDFAEKVENDDELRKYLLSLGIRHIILDPEGWQDWVKNIVVDEPYNHNIPVREVDLKKIDMFISKWLDTRMESPSGKLMWLSIRFKENERFPEIQFDADDVYEFPYQIKDLAVRMMKNGQMMQSMRLYEILAKIPLVNLAMVEIHNILGTLYLENKMFEHAIKSFSKSLSFSPNYIDAIANRAYAYQSIGQFDLALKDWEKAIALEPADAIFLAQYTKVVNALNLKNK